MKTWLVVFSILIASAAQADLSQKELSQILKCQAQTKQQSHSYQANCHANYGGLLYKSYGGPLYDGYGGNCNKAYGGACYDGYGGNCSAGYDGAEKDCPIQCYTACVAE